MCPTSDVRADSKRPPQTERSKWRERADFETLFENLHAAEIKMIPYVSGVTQSLPEPLLFFRSQFLDGRCTFFAAVSDGEASSEGQTPAKYVPSSRRSNIDPKQGPECRRISVMRYAYREDVSGNRNLKYAPSMIETQRSVGRGLFKKDALVK